MQGAPCAGGAAPPQNGFNAVAEPLSGVQARTLVRPKYMRILCFWFFSLNEKNSR